MSEGIATPTTAPSTGTAAPVTTGSTAPVEAQAPTPVPESPLVYDPAQGTWVAKLKVDGKEISTKWDDLQRDAQLSKSAQQRFDDAKQIKRENAEIKRQKDLYARALVDPQTAFEMWQAQGVDPLAMVDQMIAFHEAEAALTPEQRELREYRAQQAAWEQQEQARVEQERKQQESQAIEAQEQKIAQTFDKHLTSVGIPEDATALRDHLHFLLWQIHDDATAEGKQVSVKAAVANAIQRCKDVTKATLATMTPEERAQLLGDEAIHMSVASRAAPIPQGVQHHSGNQPRRNDGKFSKHTLFRPGTNPWA